MRHVSKPRDFDSYHFQVMIKSSLWPLTVIRGEGYECRNVVGKAHSSATVKAQGTAVHCTACNLQTCRLI
jgi:hypothetical protein